MNNDLQFEPAMPSQTALPDPIASEEPVTPEALAPPEVSQAGHDAPADEPVAAETPAVEPVVAETPATETAVAETPATETAVAETPAPVQRKDDGRARAAETWLRLSGAKESGQTISGRVKSEIKGGLLIDVEGFRAFLPASQARVAKGSGLATLVNETIPLKVLDVDEKRKRLVVSHRRALEEDRRAARTELLQSLRVGQERQAKVVRIADFGAFVDIGGVDALVPIGELAFERVEKPTDVVNVGDSFTVRILRIDEGGKKIAASRKGALADPWRDHAAVLKQGNVVEGTVVSKEPRLQIEIAPGVVGSISDREADPAEYEIGEKVEVTVRSVDQRNRRIRLSTMHSATTFTSNSFAPLGKELGV